MKKLLPILSLASALVAFHSCSNEADENDRPNHESKQHLRSSKEMMKNGESDSATTQTATNYPDPPVKDTHDWIVNP